MRNAARLLPPDPHAVDVRQIHAQFVKLRRENKMKQLAAEVELKLRAIYFDRIRPELVEGIVHVRHPSWLASRAG